MNNNNGNVTLSPAPAPGGITMPTLSSTNNNVGLLPVLTEVSSVFDQINHLSSINPNAISSTPSSSCLIPSSSVSAITTTTTYTELDSVLTNSTISMKSSSKIAETIITTTDTTTTKCITTPNLTTTTGNATTIIANNVDQHNEGRLTTDEQVINNHSNKHTESLNDVQSSPNSTKPIHKEYDKDLNSAALSTALNHIYVSSASSTAPSSPIGGIQSIRRKCNSLAHSSSPPPLQSQSGHPMLHQNSKEVQFQQSPTQSPKLNSSSPNSNFSVNSNILREKQRTNGTAKLQSDTNGQTLKYSTLENPRVKSEVRKPRLDGLKTVDSIACGSPTLTTSSSSSTTNSPILSHTALSNAPPASPTSGTTHQPWRVKLNNLKMSFLGSPRFHRKKSSLIHTTDQLNETPPSSPNSFTQSQWRSSGRSSGLEPSPLLTHKSWFNGFLTAASSHVITKGSQNAANAAAAAQDSAALAISIQSKCKEESGQIKEEHEQTELHSENTDVNTERSSEKISSNSESVDNWKNSSTTYEENNTAINNNTADLQYSTSQPSSPSYSCVSEGASKTHQYHYHPPHPHHHLHYHQTHQQSHHLSATTDIQFNSNQLHLSSDSANTKPIERRGLKPLISTGPVTVTTTPTTAINTNNASGGVNAPPEETNHVVMVKGRALNKLKAELVQTNMNSISSEREVYAVNFQLLSGPTRRFKRLCDQLQTALLSGTAHPNFVPHNALNSNTLVGGITSVTNVATTTNVGPSILSPLTPSTTSSSSSNKAPSYLFDAQITGQSNSDSHFTTSHINESSRFSNEEALLSSKLVTPDETTSQKHTKISFPIVSPQPNETTLNSTPDSLVCQ
ncbi:Serine/threonine kinase SAD-1 [Schistosoma japonicum]|nr:Serine/threonine kinase SAD-1 [Schistosoma japonicum]